MKNLLRHIIADKLDLCEILACLEDKIGDMADPEEIAENIVDAYKDEIQDEIFSLAIEGLQSEE